MQKSNTNTSIAIAYEEEDTDDGSYKAMNGNLQIKEVQGRIYGKTSDITEKDREEIFTFPLSQSIIDHLRDFYMGMKTDIPPFEYYNKSLFTKSFEISLDRKDEEAALREMYALCDDDIHYDNHIQRYEWGDDGKFYVYHFRRRRDDTMNNPIHINEGIVMKKSPYKRKRFTQLIQELGGDGAGIYQKYLSGSITYYCARGNSIEHKERFPECLLAINTCQKKENARNVSAGYGTMFTNGYCQLLYLFYDEAMTKFAGRMIVRELHDPLTNQVYMFMDRLYSKGALANAVGEVYRKIIAWFLSEGMRVVIPMVTNSGGQVAPVYRYIEKNIITVPLAIKGEDLISGLYKCVLIDDEYAGYYNDSKTLTIQTLVDKKVRHLEYMPLVDEKTGAQSMVEVTGIKS